MSAVEFPMGVQDILAYLPHRYPFLLVDRVLSFDQEQGIKGYKNMSVNEEFFQGHLPGSPVMPGVLIIEALAQISLILASLRAGRVYREPRFVSMKNFRFRLPVVPGDRLDLESCCVRERGQFFTCEVQAMVDGARAANGEMVCTALDW